MMKQTTTSFQVQPTYLMLLHPHSYLPHTPHPHSYLPHATTPTLLPTSCYYTHTPTYLALTPTLSLPPTLPPTSWSHPLSLPQAHTHTLPTSCPTHTHTYLFHHIGSSQLLTSSRQLASSYRTEDTDTTVTPIQRSHSNPTGSHANIAGSHGNIASSHGNIAGSHGNIAGSHGNIAGSHGNIAGSHGNIAGSHGNIAGSMV